MTRKPGFHESYDRSESVEVGSERSFGLVLAVVFALIGLWPLIDDTPIRVWALAASGGFLTVALVMPRLLLPLNKLWFAFGMLLHKVVTPLIMGLLFFVTIMPIGLIMRVMGKTPLPLGFDEDAKSYWIERDPPGPDPDSMRNQF